MKKKTIVKTLSVILAALCVMLIPAGCSTGTSEFSLVVEPDGATITAQNADDDSFAAGGMLTVSEGATVVAEPEGTIEGEIEFQIIPAAEMDEDDWMELDELVDRDEAVVDFVFDKGSERLEVTLPAGDYYVAAEAEERTTGTVVIRVERAEQIANPWTGAASAEEAADGAGLEFFSVPEGMTISLGEVPHASAFRYMDGMAEATIDFPAVQMTIRKGKTDESGDISGDYNEYKYQWTQNIKGLEIRCFGNREGEATKTIWTVEDDSYAILAYGLGGDTDYGLTADDLNSLINAFQ